VPRRAAKASLDILEAGIDVTSMVGAQPLAEERYREAFAVATSNPTVPNFRACVVAYDDLIRIIEGATYGTNPEHQTRVLD